MSGGLAEGKGAVPVSLRVGHLSRIDTYLDWATLSMWLGTKRAPIVIGMAQASMKGHGPGGPDGPDEGLLVRLRALVGEAREHYEAGDFPAAMSRMRVAHDLVSLHVIRISGE
ncbi:hypothetical protein GBA65_12895 [Rubrobacter marinus]|uniref:Uncharacterized protein n=1 Tax=Rubrobacter marinus TaxID=2653852 RepID=A0A6G8PYJ7_9ACTN|nr:hypothetical protein [Rubrobacter marinus]QIN79266.1 hypothetical protein GBA65_12895 [Rubrobacter marinus]